MFHVEAHYQRARVAMDCALVVQPALESLNWLQWRGATVAPTVWPNVEPWVHFFFGLAYRIRHDHTLSIAHYQQVIEAGRHEGQQQVVVRALHNMSWLCLLDGNADRAEALIVEAAPLLSNRYYVWHQDLRWAFIHHVRGDQTEALVRLKTLFAASQEPAESDTELAELVAWCCWLSGMACLRAGMLGGLRRVPCGWARMGAPGG